MKDTKAFDILERKLSTFFDNKGYKKVPVQSRLSILAACEDPSTVSIFEFAGKKWPLPQTGQMWLEYELLQHREYTGVYCSSTSYRNEKNPIKGRHDLIFPMFEFEGRGNINDLIRLEQELLDYLSVSYRKKTITYEQLAGFYKVEELGPKEEEATTEDFGEGIFITDFPESSHPFWNMKRNNDGTARKVDIIIKGMETIGSAERETDTQVMIDRFHNISNGEYSQLLFDHFSKERVMLELEQYIQLPMVPRFGGGIGMTRLARIL